jgi:hypothetical protein
MSHEKDAIATLRADCKKGFSGSLADFIDAFELDIRGPICGRTATDGEQ